jgi:hypothetical protein
MSLNDRQRLERPSEVSRTADGLLPGSPAAQANGCRCSVLANAGHGVDPGLAALVDPGCPVHEAGQRLDDAP